MTRITDDLLVKEVEIQRPVQTPDGMGGFSTSWETIRTTKCRFYSRSGLMVVTTRGIDYNREMKAIFQPEDNDYLEVGYKIVSEGDEYFIKDIVRLYDSRVLHHVEVRLELARKAA